jgi:hypothetical protein
MTGAFQSSTKPRGERANPDSAQIAFELAGLASDAIHKAIGCPQSGGLGACRAKADYLAAAAAKLSLAQQHIREERAKLNARIKCAGWDQTQKSAESEKQPSRPVARIDRFGFKEPCDILRSRLGAARSDEELLCILEEGAKIDPPDSRIVGSGE